MSAREEREGHVFSNLLGRSRRTVGGRTGGLGPPDDGGIEGVGGEGGGGSALGGCGWGGECPKAGGVCWLMGV